MLIKEKVLMRMAECCYRLEDVERGVKYLETLNK